MKLTGRLARLNQKLAERRHEDALPCVHIYIPDTGRGDEPAPDPPCPRCGTAHIIRYMPPFEEDRLCESA
jgi:hypothetical protein